MLDGTEGLYMSMEKYVRSAMQNIEKYIAKYNQRLPTRFKTPIMSGYWPETDTLTDLKTEGVTKYPEMVRVIMW